MRPTHFLLAAFSATFFLTLIPANADSPMLSASDGAAYDYFGISVALSGTTAIAGSLGSSNDQGSAHVFRNLDTANGSVTQNVKLTASDGAESDTFGYSVALSGTTALTGAGTKNVSQGAAYVFRNLDAGSGTIVEDVKLLASDGLSGDHFGKSVGISSATAVVAAGYSTVGVNGHQGSAYIFRNLDSASGTIHQDAKITASDGADGDHFGLSVAISGNTVIAGAPYKNSSNHLDQGSAYVFRNIDTASGSVTEHVKLTASDGARDSNFGSSVSISGGTAIVGSYGSSYSSKQGAAYVFRGLDSATGMITQNVRLSASTPGRYGSSFGSAVAISGGDAIVGDRAHDISEDSVRGAAYLFRNLGTATGSITQNVVLTASDGVTNDWFGTSVGLDGDRFVIGAERKNNQIGKAYTGTISAVTTLDVGSASRTIHGISFVSQDDWVIGQTRDDNAVILSSGDSATVSATGKLIAIGRTAGSEGNSLQVDGTVTANQILIGASGNKDNILEIGSSGTIHGAALRLAQNNFLSLQGNFTSPGSLLTRLGTSKLQVWDGDSWEVVTNANQATLLSRFVSGGNTTFEPLPPLPDIEVPKVRPVLTITSKVPKVPKVVSKKKLTIKGKATGSGTEVSYQVNGGRTQRAIGKNRWKAVIKLTQGKNRIRITAKDSFGASSKVKRFTVRLRSSGK
jgi:hypothetical protein